MKTKRYWLRGGIILLMYSLIFSAPVLGKFGWGSSENFPFFLQIIFIVLGLPAFAYDVWLCGMGGLSRGILSCNYSVIWQFVYNIPLFISFFILGTFLGWLYGKIKNSIHRIK